MIYTYGGTAAVDRTYYSDMEILNSIIRLILDTTQNCSKKHILQGTSEFIHFLVGFTLITWMGRNVPQIAIVEITTYGGVYKVYQEIFTTPYVICHHGQYVAVNSQHSTKNRRTAGLLNPMRDKN